MPALTQEYIYIYICTGRKRSKRKIPTVLVFTSPCKYRPSFRSALSVQRRVSSYKSQISYITCFHSKILAHLVTKRKKWKCFTLKINTHWKVGWDDENQLMPLSFIQWCFGLLNDVIQIPAIYTICKIPYAEVVTNDTAWG